MVSAHSLPNQHLVIAMVFWRKFYIYVSYLRQPTPARILLGSNW